MITAVSPQRSSPSLFLDVLRVRDPAVGRLDVPVSPANSVYARFEHLRAVASPEGGVPLFKLRVLDRLIDRLLAEGQSVPEAAHRQEPQRAEALIEELGGRLRKRLAALSALQGGFRTETGILVDLTV